MSDPMNFAIGVAAVACWQLVQDTRIAAHEQMHRDFAVNDNLTPVWDREGMVARDDGSVWALVRDATINSSLIPDGEDYGVVPRSSYMSKSVAKLAPRIAVALASYQSVWDPRDLSGSMSREALDIGLRKLAVQVQSGDWWERRMNELMGRETWKTPVPLPCPSRLLAEALIGAAKRSSPEQETAYRQLRALRQGWWWNETTYAVLFDGVKHELPGGQVVWLHGLPMNRWRKP